MAHPSLTPADVTYIPWPGSHQPSTVRGVLDLRSSFGLAVRSVRTDLGWSQERLSAESGLDRTYVSGLERGRRNPALQTLARLADALGVPLHELVKRAEESARAVHLQSDSDASSNG
ncbi:helix-turn-helix transcriptional regulator [Streptomyces sp. NPDC005500]|uniref:helix-turn-helix domain-containing protein n=1 Tax=Streptomyces sp. NPDC005500 TaxID=3155007 RepID=UPI0033A62F74